MVSEAFSDVWLTTSAECVDAHGEVDSITTFLWDDEWLPRDLRWNDMHFQVWIQKGGLNRGIIVALANKTMHASRTSAVQEVPHRRSSSGCKRRTSGLFDISAPFHSIAMDIEMNIVIYIPIHSF